MQNTTVNNHEILVMRAGELIRITACGRNAIRFQAFPDCSVIDTDYNLMPGSADAEISEERYRVTMRCGTLSVTLDSGGNVSFRNNDRVILAEKPEHTFGGRSRRFVNKGHQSWTADVSFWPHDNEHFFGMGHSWDNEFDLKGTVIDLKHINAKCTV
ncbi:MAG: hypothetical protein IJ334_18435, partial [Clostridia bacterium]|nr:hypothetical protein [Clostridia bacterium]